jgi:putative ABC transport system permease protein
VSALTSFLTTLRALRATQDSYYRDYQFADVFVSLKRAPQALIQRAAPLLVWAASAPSVKTTPVSTLLLLTVASSELASAA